MTKAAITRSSAELTNLAVAILTSVGATVREATIVAESLIAADARGIHSHGLMRLPVYIEAVEQGGIVADAPIKWRTESGATHRLDAASGFGQVAMSCAVERATELARDHGVAVIAVENSTHYGAGAYWTDQLADCGLVAFLVSTTGAAVAPFGSSQKLLGTNPLSISFPTGEQPVTADMATSAGAYGKIVNAVGAGDPIPDGWAIDAAGNPTTDAEEALKGSLLPFGGPKGSALAVMIELLAGAAGGGRFAHQTVDIWADRSSRMGTGALLLAFDPCSLHDSDAPIRRAQEFRDDLRSLEPAPGFAAVLAPGDLEAGAAERSGQDISLPVHVYDAIQALALRLGVRSGS